MRVCALLDGLCDAMIMFFTPLAFHCRELGRGLLTKRPLQLMDIYVYVRTSISHACLEKMVLHANKKACLL